MYIYIYISIGRDIQVYINFPKTNPMRDKNVYQQIETKNCAKAEKDKKLY